MDCGVPITSSVISPFGTEGSVWLALIECPLDGRPHPILDYCAWAGLDLLFYMFNIQVSASVLRVAAHKYDRKQSFVPQVFTLMRVRLCMNCKQFFGILFMQPTEQACKQSW